MTFANPDEWNAWLSVKHDKARDIWLRIGKKGSGTVSIDWEQAVEEALVWGWTTAQKKPDGPDHWLHRFTPRKPGSAATATQLREVSEWLVDIHGQHAWQSLTRPDAVRGLLDKINAVPQFEQRYEFKNAVNPYLQSDYTEAHKTSQLSWMGSVYRTGIATAALDRKQTAQGLMQTLEAGPYMAEDAKRLHLVDQLGQVRDVEAALKAKAGKNAELVDFEAYMRTQNGRESGSGPVIAVIEAEGAIVTGHDGSGNPFAGGSTIYSDDLSEAIYEAVDDKSVKAIVLRVNSPGGSDTASEQILSAIKAARAAKKPVVVSMGTYAASGGYWISSGASAIVAQPTTLTGSIGVYGGKFALGDALARFGIDVRSTTVGGEYASTFGAGSEAVKHLLTGQSEVPPLYVLLKFAATWLTAWCGVPGGICAAAGAAAGREISIQNGKAADTGKRELPGVRQSIQITVPGRLRPGGEIRGQVRRR